MGAHNITPGGAVVGLRHSSSAALRAADTDHSHRAMRTAAGIASVTASAAAAMTLAGAGTALADTQPEIPNADHLSGPTASCSTHGDYGDSDDSDVVDGAIGDVPGLRNGVFGDHQGCSGSRYDTSSFGGIDPYGPFDGSDRSSSEEAPSSGAPQPASHASPSQPSQASPATPSPDSLDTPPPPGQVRKIKLPSTPTHR